MNEATKKPQGDGSNMVQLMAHCTWNRLDPREDWVKHYLPSLNCFSYAWLCWCARQQAFKPHPSN